jgi:hypothetical protein
VKRVAALLLVALGLAVAGPSRAQPLAVDRVVVRFIAPETGGVQNPRFIHERVLAFEARLDALGDPDFQPDGVESYRERHVRSALERHIAETLLSSLRIDPPPSEEALDRQTSLAQKLLFERAGGALAVQEAAAAEGVGAREVLRVARRRARASLYLDRMVAPMLNPSPIELRTIHRTAQTPFSGQPYEKIEEPLRRWTVGRRLAAAVQAFYQNARSRVEITLLST